MKTRTSIALLHAAMLVGLSACGGGGADPVATPGPATGVDGPVPAGGGAPAPANPPLPVANVPSPAPAPNPSPGPAPSPSPSPTPSPAPGPSPSAPRALGAWSPLVDWPLLSIHAALLPDGRVMTYGNDLSRSGWGAFMYDVFDPAYGIGSPDSHLTLENRTGTYLFCSSQVLLPLSGELLLNGGDLMQGGRLLSRGNDDTNIFNPASNQLRPSSAMKRPRWYSTTTVLPNGELYIQGGTDGEDHPEIRDANGQSRLLEGIDTLKAQPGNGHPYFDNNYPRNFVAPDGSIFGFDHHWMYRVEPYQPGENGLPGRLTILGTHWDVPGGRGWVASSSAVMFRPGKILQIGGTSSNATLIDITGPTPRLKDLPRLSQVRQWANATVLADGRVLVSGGSTKNLLSDPTGQDTGQIAYHTEIFDPVTETWSIGASMSAMRLYHSVTLLLPDGSVLSTGGGAPGPVDNLNAQVYYPGYLFASDGTRASRPVIERAPGALPQVVDPGGSLQLVSPDAAAIRRVTLVKTGSVTHSFDMDQRFVEAVFSRSGNTINVQLPPASQHATPPGFYMVFVIDAAGTPSEALMIRINPTSSG